MNRDTYIPLAELTHLQELVLPHPLPMEDPRVSYTHLLCGLSSQHGHQHAAALYYDGQLVCNVICMLFWQH